MTRLKRLYRAVDQSDLAEGFRAHNLLAQAAALAWQLLFALVPLALAGVAVLGFLGIEEIWRDELSEEAKDSLNKDAYSILDRTVERVLGRRQGLWLTLGLGLAVWQFSAVLRTTMRLFSDVRGRKDERSWGRRIAISLGLTALILPCLLLAVVSAAVGGRLVQLLDLGLGFDVLLFVVRWGLVVALLLAVLWLVHRFAPPAREPVTLIWRGPLIVVGAWVAAAALYGWYVSDVASYTTLYGGFASVIVLLGFLNIITAIFVSGVQADQVLRERGKGR